MVHRAPKPSKTIIFAAIIFLLVSLGVFFGIKLIKSSDEDEAHQETAESEQQDTIADQEPDNSPPELIDLQDIVDQWSAPLGNNAGVYIYDLDNDTVVGGVNQDKIFFTASIYKLFFVYEAYLRIEQGIDDGEEYFTDGKTRLECLDLIIRESYNPCADPLRREMINEIEDIISNKFQIDNTKNGALYASAEAVAEMLKIYYYHEELSEELWLKIADSMLNQPITTYDWRQGLPAGFSTAKVYDKVGWNSDGTKWTTYNDAAIVEFPDQERHYIVVVLTTNTSNTKVADLGRLIEEVVINYD